MIAFVVVEYNLGLVEHRKQALHTVSERNPEEVAGVVHMVVVHTEIEVAVPIAVHKEVVQVVRMVVVVAHKGAAEVVQLSPLLCS